MQIRRLILAAAVALLCVAGELCWVWQSGMTQPVQGDFIHYVDFNIPEQALSDAMKEDQKREGEVRWIDILAGLACRNGANWEGYSSGDASDMALRLEQGEDMEGNEYFSYYRQAYEAVLGGLLGDFAEETTDSDGNSIWEYQYGLKAYLPIAAGFDYSESDDFGARRTYGYSRPHLGHDMMGLTGTPVVAVESGTVVMLGWNQYGGWRIGIRSEDGKRYWYYAHLRKDRPYASGLKEGDRVTAGDVIGYMGRTGYSATENVNNIETPHLHIGLELIFDESQFESDNEIWVDIYPLMRLLRAHRSVCTRGEDGEYTRAGQFLEAGS
ncbi:MAG: M23 family metallopeptidase [Eubacteriales bacterium]|nr:M23 family metallopeptidase [Eubacteriales bacterium]